MVGSYRNKSEERVAGHLNELGVAFEYEPQDQKVKYTVERIAYYLPDFVLPGGTILEVKGWLTSADRAKYIRIKKSNPDIDLRFVFDRSSSKLSKTSKTTYAQWAEQHGFLWCEKIIPPTWIERAKHARTTSKAPSTKNPPAPRKGIHLTHGGTHRPRYLSVGGKRL